MKPLCGLRRPPGVSQTDTFRQAERAQQSLLAPIEKRVLLWLARRVPLWIHSDHLTALGFLSLLGCGLTYWYSGGHPAALILVNVFLVLNWLGDSLDGTLARVRNCQRPRYGFYMDHVLDACGTLFLLGGLALSGHMSERIAIGLLLAYFLLNIEVYLATYTIGTFHMSHGKFSPTELRLLLMIGNMVLLFQPVVRLAGCEFLLFDVGGAAGVVGMTALLIRSIVKHTIYLYRAERLP